MVVRLLYRKMFLEFFIVFVVCLAVFISIVLTGRLIQLNKIFIALNISFKDIFFLIVYLIPFFCFVLFPVCTMLSLFLTFQRMSTDQELIALRAGGISIKNIMPCPLFFLTIICMLNFYISFHGISWGMENFTTYMYDLVQKKTKMSIKPGIFNTKIPGITIYVQNMDQESNQMKNIFIKQKNIEKNELMIISPMGILKWDPIDKTIYLQMYNGKIYTLSTDITKNTIISFRRYDFKLHLKDVFKSLKLDPNDEKFLSYKRLKEAIEKEKNKSTNRYVELVEEKHKRWALPISCVVLGLFSIPLGWILEGMKKFYGSIIIMIIFFIYYTFFAMGKSLVEGGILDPFIGIWSPNIIFSIITVIIFHLALKEKIKFSIRD